METRCLVIRHLGEVDVAVVWSRQKKPAWILKEIIKSEFS